MNISETELQQIFDRFASFRALVVGDVMIDAYLHGKVDRISPEAPVPVVSLRHRENLLGGAANVALNIKSLGAEAVLCSVIGNDRQGAEFLSLMQKENLKTDGIIRSDERITTTKFRIIGNRMQMLRVDEEMDTDLSEKEATNLLNLVAQLISDKKPDIIILQDYNKGVLTPAVIQQLIALANAHNIPVAVDPKKKNFTAYKGVTLFKPNLKEVGEGLKIEIDAYSIGSLQNAAMQLHQHQDIEMVMITLSEHGVFLSWRDDGRYSTIIAPAAIRNISDVSGAGDTVIGVAALCLAAKVNPALLANLSNIAGGLVCEQSGVVPVDKTRLLEEAKIELP